MRTSIVAALIVAASIVPCSIGKPAEARAGRERSTLLKAVVLNMGTDGPTVTDSRYNGLFREGLATAGVAAVIRAGRFSINGQALPGTAAAFDRSCPKGYLVNQVPWLFRDAAGSVWKGGYKAERSHTSYDAAALATATGIVAGLEVRLYDTDQDGYADLIDADYKEGVIASRITRNDDETFAVYRGDIDTANKTSMEGRAFDGPSFSATSGERIKARNFDRTIRNGDVALFWFGPDGWVIQRARRITGAFTGGVDHKTYTIGGVAYQDAMRFSRDNVPVSSRPGEYANAQTYFGFDTAGSGASIRLWLVPTTNKSVHGAPVALTSGQGARTLLTRAVGFAEQKMGAVTASADGSDVPRDRTWVTPTVYVQTRNAITRAKVVLQSPASTSSLIDYHVYLLYLALAGSDGDIGAKFAGFKYGGLVHEVKSGRKGASPR